MSDKESEKYIKNACMFQGKMNLLANSIDLLLSVILEKSEINPPKMLGAKIKEFKRLQSVLENNCNSDFVELTNKLERFNNNWVITKHGMIVGGTQNLTICKGDKIHVFDQARQAKIDEEFTQIIAALTEISNNL